MRNDFIPPSVGSKLMKTITLTILLLNFLISFGQIDYSKKIDLMIKEIDQGLNKNKETVKFDNLNDSGHHRLRFFTDNNDTIKIEYIEVNDNYKKITDCYMQNESIICMKITEIELIDDDKQNELIKFKFYFNHGRLEYALCSRKNRKYKPLRNDDYKKFESYNLAVVNGLIKMIKE